MSKTAYVGIGSNLGDKLSNCLKAIEMVDNVPDCRVIVQSDFFRTDPVGVEGHDWYVNGAISLETDLSAHELLNNLLAIEANLGRKRNKKWEPRTIDLDILLFGQDVIDEKDLTIPHPLMHLRKFVLMPMVQLVPNLVHPVLGNTMEELLNNPAVEGQTAIPLEEA
jgi:2-amino-4-hydroxy-6-hydroxymethyldihydropteridine diphosphokinase